MPFPQKIILQSRQNNVRMTSRFTSRSQVKSVAWWTLRGRWQRSLSRVQRRSLMLVRDVLVSKNRRVDHHRFRRHWSAKQLPSSCRTTSGRSPSSIHDGHLIGIFSERDVLRIIHNRGEGFGRLPVSDVMTRDPITCRPRRRRRRRHGQDERTTDRQGARTSTAASSWASSRSATSSRSSTTSFMPSISISCPIFTGVL